MNLIYVKAPARRCVSMQTSGVALTEEAMKANEGAVDRFVRIAAGLLLLSLVFVGPKTAWGYLGLVPLVTGLVGWCPLYAVFRIHTRGRRHA